MRLTATASCEFVVLDELVTLQKYSIHLYYYWYRLTLSVC